MSKKTTSQIIARVFEIVGYILLVPASISLFYAALFLFLPAFVPAILGIILLVGYFNHSRGEMDEGKILSLWAGTFFFNLLPFVAGLYLLYSRPYASPVSTGFMLWGALIGWWGVAVFLSGFAFYKEIINQKYR